MAQRNRQYQEDRKRKLAEQRRRVSIQTDDVTNYKRLDRVIDNFSDFQRDLTFKRKLAKMGVKVEMPPPKLPPIRLQSIQDDRMQGWHMKTFDSPTFSVKSRTRSVVPLRVDRTLESPDLLKSESSGKLRMTSKNKITH